MKKALLLLSFMFMSFAGFSQVYQGPLFPYQNDGLFLRNQNSGAIFLIFEGTKRYIQTVETLNGLFINANSLIRDVSIQVLDTYPTGSPISTASGFIRSMPDQRIYLREGTLLRWVSTIEIAHTYSFNLSIAQNVTSLAGYTIGSSISR